MNICNSGKLWPLRLPRGSSWKKYASWRLYVDYRDLDKGIIKNKFSIPLVDDSLDELVGSTNFFED